MLALTGRGKDLSQLALRPVHDQKGERTQDADKVLSPPNLTRQSLVTLPNRFLLRLNYLLRGALQSVDEMPHLRQRLPAEYADKPPPETWGPNIVN